MRSVTVHKLLLSLTSVAVGLNGQALKTAGEIPNRPACKAQPPPLRIDLRALKVVPAEYLPAIKAAAERLKRPQCAAAVGGEFFQFVIPRVDTVQYALDPSFVSAAKDACGNIQVVYCVALQKFRELILYKAFLRPQQITIRLPSGQTEQVDSVVYFARALGLKEGVVTVTTLQAIILLHEHAHFNGMALDDLHCVGASMLNTRYVMEACYPELIQNAITPVAAAASPDQVCLSCHDENRVTSILNGWATRREQSLAKALAQPSLSPNLKPLLRRSLRQARSGFRLAAKDDKASDPQHPPKKPSPVAAEINFKH